MDIETAANPADVTDTPAPETQEPAASTEAQTPAEGTTETDPLADLLPPEEDTIEVEYEGAKYKLPPALKDALLRQSDYTRKTTDLAEQRRTLEAERTAVEQARSLSAAEVRAVSRLDGLNAQLAEYEGIDWASLDVTDPKVQQHHWRYQQLIGERATLTGQLNDHFRIKSERDQQEAAKFRETTDAEVAKMIKDWSPEKRATLETFAVNQGVPKEALALASPAEFKLINLANIGHQFIERQRAAARASAASAATPAPEVGGGAPAGSGDPNTMTMEEFARWRAAGNS